MCGIGATKELTETYSQKREGKGVKQTEQMERGKRVGREGSLDKDRQKDRISLSHSRGREKKQRLQRE